MVYGALRWISGILVAFPNLFSLLLVAWTLFLEVPQCRLSTGRLFMSSDGNGILTSQIWYEYAGVAAARKPAFVPFLGGVYVSHSHIE